MRIAIWIVMLVGALSGHAAAEPLNAVIGDQGWAGRVALDAPDEDRIAAHLAYVESELRAASEAYAPPVRARRLAILDHLAAYRAARQFPHNTYVAHRVPVFVDAAGRRCAVGALAERDLGAAAIDRIGAAHRLARLGAIADAELAAWVATSGFSVRELAMIQPEYARPPGDYKPPAPTRQDAVARTLDIASELCTADLGLKLLSVPSYRVTIDVQTAAITWERKSKVPKAWRKCIAAYVKQALPSKWLGQGTVTVGHAAVLPLVEGKPRVLHDGRTIGFITSRLERALGACKVPAAPEYEPYRVSIRLAANGAIDSYEIQEIPQGGTECVEAEIERWKFPVGLATPTTWNLGIQPRSTASQLGEVATWAAQNLKRD